MTTIKNLISITKGKQAVEIVAERRETARAAALERVRRERLMAKEIEEATLTNTLSASEKVIARSPSFAAAILVPSVGVAVWAAYRHITGYGDTTSTVALAVSLAVPVAVASRWAPALYPKLRIPVAVILSAVVVALGAASVATVVSPLLMLPWLGVVVALGGVMLQQSLSAWDLRRDQLKRAALEAEVEVRRAELGIAVEKVAVNTAVRGGSR